MHADGRINKMVLCKKWVLAKAFHGKVTAENFRLEEEDISDKLKDGGLFLVLIMLSVFMDFRLGSVLFGHMFQIKTHTKYRPFKTNNYS